MARSVTAFPWERTPVGALEDWPPVLKSMVSLILASHFPQCIVWAPGLTTIPNDAFLPILGDKPDALGRGFADVWAEAWPDIAPIAEAAYRGEATFIENFPLEVDRGDGMRSAWFTFCYSPIRDEAGRICGFLDTVIETTETVQAQERERILAGELAHRIKNLLSVFQSIAHQTFRALPPEQAFAVFDARLAALGEANAMLVRRDWTDMPLADVVAAALAPHLDRPGRLHMEGPATMLGGGQALSVALAVHELATNALKYGALSTPEGRIAIRWSGGATGSDAPFAFVWEENGGPMVAPPQGRGFGTRLIERVLPRDLGGAVSLDYRPEGLAMTLTTTMRSLTAIGADEGVATG